MRPYFVEVLGTPEAGKTTAIKEASLTLKNKGYKIGNIQESAEVVPPQLPKASLDAHFWMRMHTSENLLAAFYSNNDIILADRGIMDTLFWNYLYFCEGRLTQTQLDASNTFFSDFQLLPKTVILLYTTPEESIRRRGGEGRIVTKQFISRFNQLLMDYCGSLKVPLFQLDTTNVPKDIVSDYITNVIERQYHESL